MSTARPATDAARAKDARSGVSHEWPARALFGVLLALAGVFFTLAGGFLFAGFTAVAAMAAVREWYRMVDTAHSGRDWAIGAVSIAAALACAAAFPRSGWPLTILASGMVIAAAFGAWRGTVKIGSALGILYIGVPAWSIVALRLVPPGGEWIVLGVFLVIWTADTSALIVGYTLGGPKLIPALSPNKTWAGFVGGILVPGVAAAIYVSILGGSGLRGFALGLLLAVAGHAGDLFESWVKRRVDRKNSGGLIPGHGGVLDRLDSTLFVAPLAAVLIFAVGAAPLFGVHP
jgi:phosphatidate cytidylyltransferase